MERNAVHGAIQHNRRDHPIVPQASDERCRAPMAPRHAAEQPLSGRRPAALPCHVGLGPGLVEKDQVLYVKFGFQAVPALARLGNIGAQLLGGDQRLFLSVSPSRRSLVHMVLVLTDTPSCVRAHSHSSASVASGTLAT